MKLLLVLCSEEIYNLLSVYVKPLGFEIIRYNYVQKAMDNIDEINPAGVIISACDFPRQWKIMVQFVRSERAKEACPVILLCGENFPAEEAAKASFLEVNGMVSETLIDPSEVNRMQGILSRYLPVTEKRQSRRIIAENWQRLGFVFSRPLDKILVTGDVKDISQGGFSFFVHNPLLAEKMRPGIKLEECSFRAGDSLLSPVCRLIRAGRIASFEFFSFPLREKEILEEYIEKLPMLELSAKNTGGKTRKKEEALMPV